MQDRIDVIACAAREALTLCQSWLPNGKLDKNKKWVALNPTREDKELGSFVIDVFGDRSGFWYDFSTNDGGKNMVSLYCYINRMNPSNKDDYRKAIKIIENSLGLGD